MMVGIAKISYVSLVSRNILQPLEHKKKTIGKLFFLGRQLGRQNRTTFRKTEQDDS